MKTTNKQQPTFAAILSFGAAEDGIMKFQPILILNYILNI